MSAVVFTLHQRPFYTRQVLESWTQVRGVENWRFYFRIDPSSQTEQQVSIIKEYEERLPVEGYNVNHEKLGVLRNPHRALSQTFFEGHQYVVLAEEDVEPATDALEYFEFAKTHDQFLAACAWSDGVGLSAENVSPRKWFNPWLWGCSEAMWRGIIELTWDLDYSTGDERGPGGWDCNLGLRVVHDYDMEVLFPHAARSQHIGKWLGVHQDPNQFGEQEQPVSFVKDREAVEWSLKEN